MRFDRAIVVIAAVVLVAAAVVFLTKRTSTNDQSESISRVPVAEQGTLSLLVVGIEGMDLTIAEKLIAEGTMPNLEALMAQGATQEFATLGKTVDKRIAWTSLVTGVSPANQGVGGNKMSPRGSVVEASLSPKSRTVGTLWTALSDSGVRVGVLGWWGEWPVEQLNGVTLAPHNTYVLERSHQGIPERQLHPLEFLDTVDGLMSDPSIYRRTDLGRFIKTDSVLGYEALIGQGYLDLSAAYAADRSMLDVAKAMEQEADLSTEFVALSGTELVSQRFWHMAHPEQIDWDALTETVGDLVTQQSEALSGTIDAYYAFVDEILGELTDLTADGATVAVVSDHGYDGLYYGPQGNPLIGQSMHSTTGFWVIDGPRVNAGVRCDKGDILDFAPTVAAAAGIELGGSVEGKVCRQALR